MANGSRPCVIGVGARTALGQDAASSAAAVRGSISGRAEHPFMVDKSGEPMYVARDTHLPPDLLGSGRLIALAASALQLALPPLSTARVPCFIGCPESRPGHPAAYDDELARELARTLPRVSFEAAGMLPHGHSSGLLAMQLAISKIERGECEFCLAGGVESYLQPETLEWLDDRGKLMSGENRSGFTPGEGAGFCLIASDRTAHKYQLPVLCQIAGVGTGWEENGINSEGVCVGKGMSSAVSEGCKSLRPPAERIDFTYSDLNGERYRSEEFTFAAMRTQRLFLEITDNLTPADCWGDVGAASGPLFAALAIASAARGYAKGPRVLLWTSSESGRRAAALLALTLQMEDR